MATFVSQEVIYSLSKYLETNRIVFWMICSYLLDDVQLIMSLRLSDIIEIVSFYYHKEFNWQ